MTTDRAIDFDWELEQSLADDSDNSLIGMDSPEIDGPGPFLLAAIAGVDY